MDKRIISLYLLLSMALLPLCAMDNIMHEINAIKSQGSIYLYAESTSSSWEDAQDNAQYLLEIEIDEWLKSQGMQPRNGYMTSIRQQVYNLRTMRGDRYRVFVYVNKNEIIAMKSGNILVIMPPVNENFGQESATEEAKPQTMNIDTPYTPTTLEKKMLAVRTTSEINSFAASLQREGLMRAYGTYKDMPQEAECYLFVYNRNHEIVAWLHKEGNAYLNIKTGAQDSIHNYKGNGAGWIQFK